MCNLLQGTCHNKATHGKARTSMPCGAPSRSGAVRPSSTSHRLTSSTRIVSATISPTKTKTAPPMNGAPAPHMHNPAQSTMNLQDFHEQHFNIKNSVPDLGSSNTNVRHQLLREQHSAGLLQTTLQKNSVPDLGSSTIDVRHQLLQEQDKGNSITWEKGQARVRASEG